MDLPNNTKQLFSDVVMPNMFNKKKNIQISGLDRNKIYNYIKVFNQYQKNLNELKEKKKIITKSIAIQIKKEKLLKDEFINYIKIIIPEYVLYHCNMHTPYGDFKLEKKLKEKSLNDKEYTKFLNEMFKQYNITVSNDLMKTLLTNQTKQEIIEDLSLYTKRK